jgi:hypothetical protein
MYKQASVRDGSCILFSFSLSVILRPDFLSGFIEGRNEEEKRYRGLPDRHALDFDFAQPS